MYYHYYREEQNANQFVTIEREFSNVIDEENIDIVTIKGISEDPISNYYKDIIIEVENKKTGTKLSIPLPTNQGYFPGIFLGNFISNGVDQIGVSLYAGANLESGIYYLYSVKDGKVDLIFDSQLNDKDYRYIVKYRDYYLVDVVSIELEQVYTISIEDVDPEILSRYYNEDGTLKQTVVGNVLPYLSVYPIDFAKDYEYELLTINRIIGPTGAEILGTVETILKWDEKTFEPVLQTVSIFGSPVDIEVEKAKIDELIDIEAEIGELKERIADLERLRRD